MKAKNKITYIGAILLVLISFSCSEKFLELNPLDQIASEVFWKSEKDVDMAVAGCYASLTILNPQGCFLNYQRGYMDALTDNAFAQWDAHNIEKMNQGILNASSGGVKDNIYKLSYDGIARCNYVLDNISKATDFVNKDSINVAKAEVRFLRAFFYFNVVECFGEIPLYKESPKSVEAAKVAKSSKADVLKFIHEDLDFAIANLPDKGFFSDTAVKGSAMGIKVRVLISEKRWSETAALAQQIMSSGKFSIYKDYASMFIKAGQRNNPEIMFSSNYLTPQSHGGASGINGEFTVQLFLRNNLLDAYECTDGKSILESPLYDPKDPFKNREPRFNATVRFPNENWAGYYPYGQYNPATISFNKKCVDPTINGSNANQYLNDWNIVLLRYADVLLMYAEAKNEVSGPDASVYAAINEVRSRPSVNMPPVNQSKYNTKELVRDYIRHERRIEFVLEGLRYFDLKRWGTLVEVMNSLPTPTGVPYRVEQKHYYWPFNQNELDNNPNLKQTSGY